MSGDGGVVAPDFAEQRFPGDGLLSCTVEVAQDLAFLFRQSDLAPRLLMQQQLVGRLEGKGTDAEDRIFAVLVLSQLGAQASQQNAEPEGLGHVVVRPEIDAENLLR